MAYTYQYTGNGDPSTVLRSDGAEFPQDPGNADYQNMLLFVAGGGTVTPAAEPDLEDVQDSAKLTLNSEAADARTAVYLAAGLINDPLGASLRFAEAQRWADQSFASPGDDAEAPLLEAEINATNTTVDAVATVVLAELAALKAQLAALEGQRLGFHEDVDAAADAEEVQDVLDGASYDPAP